MHQKIDNLTNEIKLSCKCNCDDFRNSLLIDSEKKITRDLNESSADCKETLRSEIENLKNLCAISIANIGRETSEFRESVCEQLKSSKINLTDGMTELQAMMDTKLDKCYVPDLKKYLKNMLLELEQKTDTNECKRALETGVAKRIFKGPNGVSCGDDIIQTKARNQGKSLSKGKEENAIHTDFIQLQPLKLLTRLCGGKHTITKPSERVFDQEMSKLNVLNS